MIDLSLYVGKKVTITLRNGEIWKGVTVSHDKECEYPYVVGDDLGEDFFYQNGQRYSCLSEYDIVSVIPHETNLCNEIPMPEPDMTPEIDLSQFVGKKVKAKLRGGITVTDRVMRGPVKEYPFTLSGYSYAANGRRLEDNELPLDIISLVELVEVVKGQPTDAEAIYVARNLDGKFLFAAPALKTLQDYVRGNYPADAHLDINITTEYLTNG